MERPHALIAGAGIGGLSAALCLAEAGWRVSIFESAPALEEVGAGLQLSPNASAILRRLGALEPLLASSLSPQSILVRRGADAAILAEMSLKDAARRFGAPYILSHRADLQRALLDAVARTGAITLRTGAAILGFRQDEEGVAARLDGETAEASGDCLIGADGVRSAIRGKLFAAGQDGLAYAGRTAWRALVKAERAPPDALTPKSCLWLGRKAHLVHYPLRGGSVVNVVAIVEEEQEPAERGWSGQGEAGFLRRRFADWAAPARAILEGADEWRKWPLYGHAPLAGWSSGRVALLGDAAHPMPPFLAQGAAQAIEDAAALGRALRGADDIAGRLAAYSAARIGRATRVQQQSHAQGRIYHMAGPAAFVRDATMRALGAAGLFNRYDWIYGGGPAFEARPHRGLGLTDMERR